MLPFEKLMTKVFGQNTNSPSSKKGFYGQSLQTKKSAASGKDFGGTQSTWLTTGDPNWSGRTYDTLVREGFRNNVVANRSVKILAESAASVPLKLYKGGRQVERHSVLDLLKAPNPLQSGRELLEAFYAFLQIAGNSYMETVNLADGTPGELYVLRPDRMSIIPGPNGWPERYVYKVAGRSHSFAVEGETGSSDILHLNTDQPSGNINIGLEVSFIDSTLVEDEQLRGTTHRSKNIIKDDYAALDVVLPNLADADAAAILADWSPRS